MDQKINIEGAASIAVDDLTSFAGTRVNAGFDTGANAPVETAKDAIIKAGTTDIRIFSVICYNFLVFQYV